MIDIDKIKEFFFFNWKDFSLDEIKYDYCITNNDNDENKKLNMGGFLYELKEIMKLNTVLEYNSLKAENKELYYKLVTDKNLKKDELGVIKNGGMYLTKKEFKQYKQLLEELYKARTI